MKHKLVKIILALQISIYAIGFAAFLLGRLDGIHYVFEGGQIVESAWVKVRTKDGAEGWCFAGYLTDGTEYREPLWKSTEKAEK